MGLVDCQGSIVWKGGQILGRKTFEIVLAFGVWPYGKKPVVVLKAGRSLDGTEHSVR